MTGPVPLSGLVVVEIGTSVAAPTAAQIFAELGAEVFKIENPAGGDDARSWGPPFVDGVAAMFVAINRNKRSVAIDLKDGEQREALRRFILARADVVLQNLRAGVVEEEDPQPDPKLPPMYAHGDPDPRPVRSWLVKHLLPKIGHGLISGQWGTYKTFVAFDLAVCVMTGQPFLNRTISRQSGVLFIAAEGAGEVRLRINAVVREKCGGMPRAPFRWYEVAPTLLQRGAVGKLVAMAKQAETSLQQEFGLPLGLIIIDTIAASAGYNEVGAENDNATGQAVMNALNQVARQMKCCVLGVDHFGKNIDAGTRGGSAKESSAEVVLAVLGAREISGRVVNTRVALRKVRGAPQGEEFYFAVRSVEDPEPDEDGEAVTTLVIDWQAGPPNAGQAKPEMDPWQGGRRADTRQALVLLRRVLMTVLAERGMPQQVDPDGPTRQAVELKILRTEFYAQIAADVTPEQKRDFRKKKFQRALEYAQEKGLIGIREINSATYVWLSTPDREDEDADVI